MVSGDFVTNDSHCKPFVLLHGYAVGGSVTSITTNDVTIFYTSSNA